MAAARYWRIRSVETYAGGDLELSEVALYAGSTRVFGSVSSTVAPVSGALADLSDENFGTSVGWAGDKVQLPGFAIEWDFGSPVEVTSVAAAGPNESAFLFRFMVEHSSDGENWSPLGVAHLAHNGTGFSVPFSKFDPYYPQVALQVAAKSSIFDASIGNKALTVAGTAGGVTISSSIQNLGENSLSFSSSVPGWVECPHDPSLSFGGADFTVEAFVRPEGSGEMGFYGKRASAGGYMPLGVYVRSNRLFIIGSFTGGSWDVNGAFANGSIPVPDAQFTHVAVCRIGPNIFTFVGGTLDQTFTVGSNSLMSNDAKVSVGASAQNGDARFKGHLHGLRVTLGKGRYETSFTPPDSPYVDSATIAPLPLRSRPYSQPVVLGSEVLGFTTSRFAEVPLAKDIYDSGKGRVVGTVKEKGTPNAPLKREVFLFDQITWRQIRATWSDPVTGEYVFNELDMNRKYAVVAEDYTHMYRAVIADNLSPELMPQFV